MKLLKSSCFYCILALSALVYGCIDYSTFEITEKPFVDKSSVELYIGEQAEERNQIQLKSSPADRQYIWTSLDPEIATVDRNGLVTARQEGSTVIVVASGDDQTNVSVRVRKFIPLTGFTLNMSSVTGFWQDLIQPLVIPVPENATEVNIQWYSSNEEVASVFGNGLIKIVGVGTAIVTARANDITRTITVTGDLAVEKLARGKWTIPGYNASSYLPTIGYSSHHPGYVLMNLFDGNATTFWHASYNAAYISNYPHWFIVDMHRTAVITEVMLQRRQGNFPSANGFYLYTCPDVAVDQNDPVDGYPWEDQGEYAFNSGIDAEQRIVIPATPTARYIKVYFDTKHKTPGAPNNYAQFAEFAVYGY